MHANLTAGQPTTDLVLDRLPNGELAWLRAESSAEDRRYVLTQTGRDYLARARAMQALFGQPWPSVAEAQRIGTCPACHQLQTDPDCATREHWG